MSTGSPSLAELTTVTEVAGPCRHKPLEQRCLACILDTSDYFRGLRLGAKLALQQHLQRMVFSHREPLYREGEPSERLFILMTGEVKVYKSLSDGRQQIHKLALVPGDLIACEDLYLDRYSSGAEAIGAVMTCCVRKGDFMSALAQHHEIGDTMMRTMARNLNSYIRHIANLGQKRAIERVAAYLVFLRETHEARALDNELLNQSLSRAELADMLGVTQRTLIRSLKTLETRKVISLARGGFGIRDLNALVRLADGASR